MKIFVAHYTKLTDRKPHMIQQFAKHGITDYEFVEVYDKEQITKSDASTFVKLTPPKVSLMLKHFHIYKQIADNHENALILEDDVILADNFVEKLDRYMSQVPSTFDMVFIGNGCNLHIEKSRLKPDVFIYEKCLHPTTWGGDGISRCTDSYIVSKKCAIQLCKEMEKRKVKKISLAIDWWLNAVARPNQFKGFWAEPTIVTQGSQIGMFQSVCTPIPKRNPIRFFR
jgi:GR25 family glycosyltransferase involved in LPS biosynthesis